MKVLAVVHGEITGPEIFGEVAEERGHQLEIWSSPSTEIPASEPGDYGAVLVFGGVTHADDEDRHPWLRAENAFLRRLLELGIPTLGICLGAQLLVKAANGKVGPAAEPEIGWHDVELTEAARDDPVFATFPRRFRAFHWHHYAADVPEGAVELARSRLCPQAFRIGDRAWGVLFHPEVREEQIHDWLSQGFEIPVPPETVRLETAREIGSWNELGRTLCNAFLGPAETGNACR